MAQFGLDDWADLDGVHQRPRPLAGNVASLAVSDAFAFDSWLAAWPTP